MSENNMEVQCITDLEKAFLLQDQWTKLLEKSEKATPFQDPVWILNWQKYFGRGRTFILCCFAYDKLVGVLPLHYAENKTKKNYSFIGEGITDYLDVICLPELENQVIDICYTYLMKNIQQGDSCVFNFLRSDSPLLLLKRTTEPAIQLLEHDSCLSLSLPKTKQEFEKNLNLPFKKNILYCIRKFKSQGELLLKQANENNYIEYLSELFKLHTARWNERSASGVLYDIPLQQFHRHIFKEMMTKNRAALFSLDLNNITLATLYILLKGNCYYYYIGGFNPVYQKFSPGSIALYYLIRYAIDNGKEIFDFLRGQESYKYKWGATDKVLFSLTLKK
ncbi:MAG: GNAT family N-acetyltransferase [Methanococcaceae archaeon]